MSAQIYFSSGSFVASSLAAMLDQCEKEALPGLEFSSGLPYAPAMLEEARGAAARPINFLVHNYFPPPAEPFVLNLASSEEATLSASHALCRRGIDLCGELDAPFYSVHSGFAMNLQAGQLGRPDAQAGLATHRRIDRGLADEIFARSVRELTAYAQVRGRALLLENNVLTRAQAAAGRADSLLMTSPREVRAFLDEHPGAGFLLDVAHAKVAARALGFAPEEFFELLADRIGALHLSENDGERDNNGQFDRTAWFVPFLKDFAHVPMVIEVYRLTAEERARQYDVLTALIA